MIFDWADVKAVGLIMRDTEADDFCGGAPTFRRVSQAIANGHATRHAPRTIAIANYEHHNAIAGALREAFAAGGMAGYEDGRDGGYEEGYADGSEALLEDSDIGDGPWETK